MLLVLNAHYDLVQFTLPACPGGRKWALVLDTNAPDQDGGGAMAPGERYGVTARSLLLLELTA